MAERIMFAGDGHGDLAYYAWVLQQAYELEVDHLVQCGDFGYWEHRQHGVEFLDLLDHALRAVDLELHWVDGNHENHTLLRERYAPNGLTHIRSHIVYVPRGVRWNWDGVDFLGIGGAYSIDKDWRIQQYQKKARYSSKESAAKYEQWWPEEKITDEEVQLAIAGGPVDVVVSHDVPTVVDIFAEFAAQGIEFWKWDADTVENRTRLMDVFDAVTPKRWFHGHYHIDYRQKVDSCLFTGLNCNINQFGVSHWSWNRAITVMSTDEI